MGFITGLPVLEGYPTILVVIDRLYKQAHFGALPRSYSAPRVANLFVQMVYRLHGIPRSIVSDRDAIFLSRYQCELFSLSGTILKRSTTYHPQTDGQFELINRVLQQYLRCFVAEQPRKWYKFFPWVEYCYNINFHSSLGMSLFKALYGHDPPSTEAVDWLLTHCQDLLQQLKDNLVKAQKRMKKVADGHRRDLQFHVGDLVLVKLQPYRQICVANRVSNKLGPWYFGPFQVRTRVGKVAYQLELPSSARIHNVFHISLLKPYNGQQSTSSIRANYQH